MKVLLVNKFFYARGGSEAAMFLTAKVLKEHGHQVAFFSMARPDNLETPAKKYFVSAVDFEKARGLREKLRAAGRLLYSFEARRKLEALLRDERPDIAHLHNIHHQISPSILHTLKKHDIPVVMTLHDYKVVCPTYNLFRRGRPCELCRNGRFYHCVTQKCSKDSWSKSLLAAVEMYLHHDLLRTPRLVDVYLSPSRFLADKAGEMGFKENIAFLPNALDLEEYRPATGPGENRIVTFGRLAPEKGLGTLLHAMEMTKSKCLIIGRGPLQQKLEERARRGSLTNVSFSGYLQPVDLRRRVRNSRGVVVPSEWYENNPIGVLESFALGRPVIASRIGGLPELVKDGRTGWTFEPGNAEDLKDKIEALLASPARAAEMGRKARRFVEQGFGADLYYRRLMDAYRTAAQGKA